jgi:hypothetical protein
MGPVMVGVGEVRPVSNSARAWATSLVRSERVALSLKFSSARREERESREVE